ncbi:MAG: PAS domain S-box protein [Solirubrobacteraceae bacterium]|nr:PAS domain S-box protein [Solirubrobacteraceae bacterium]
MSVPPATDQPDFALARAVLHAALDCVITIDDSGTIVDFNPAAEATFGYAASEAIGREMADLIVPEALRAQHREGLRRYLTTGQARVLGQRIQIPAVRADGAERMVELAITRATVPGRNLFVGYLRDITDQLAAEQELVASRTRIVEAADESRRRLERDLHDGAQQQLVGLALTLRLARDRVESDPQTALELLAEATSDLESATAELRDLARGIHPAVLTEGGLRPALRSLVTRSPVTVDLQLDGLPQQRLPAAVEATAYFTVSEGLTNVVRYAEASTATVAVGCSSLPDAGAAPPDPGPQVLTVTVADDGVGGADPAAGSGLRGLSDRVGALGGTLVVTSPPGVGTTLIAELPCGSS